MLKFIVTGNLGADAVLHRENGREFVTMSIAETQRRTLESGEVKETTRWVSATWNGDGGNLLKYLVRGTKICVIGDGDYRVFHSEKQRRLVAGVNVFVREIELIGSQPDAVPRTLYDSEGAAHYIERYYHCPDFKEGILINQHGNQFNVDNNGWVFPQVQNEEEQAAEQATGSSEQAAEQTTGSGEQAAEQATGSGEQAAEQATGSSHKATTLKKRKKTSADSGEYQGY